MQDEDLDNNKQLKLSKPVRSYFKKLPGVVAVYIFGSQAKGKEPKDSYVDLAVLIDKELLGKQFVQKNT